MQNRRIIEWITCVKRKMKQIPLTQNKFALVDDADFEELSKYRWYTRKCRNTFYAARHVRTKEGTIIYMHAFLIGTLEGMHTDHIDGNSLNNQRKNLRMCTTAENGMNRGKQKNNKSGYKGVSRHSGGKRWQAKIM